MRRASIAFAGFALSACHQPAPPPIVSIDDHVCVDRPELAKAKYVPLDKDKSVTETLDAKTPCLQAADGEKSTYLAFELPNPSKPYFVSVASIEQGQGMFTPRLIVLDSQGNALREISRDSFLFHGSSIQAGFRIHDGDHYLVVTSDTKSVGSEESRIVEATQTYATSSGVSVHTGSETTDKLTYAYNGRVTVSAQPLPDIK